MLAVASYYGYGYLRRQSELNALVPVTVDGVSYLTTGALPGTAVDENLAIKELISLGDKGTVTTKEFHIIHKSGSDFTIELLKPYDQNKQIFIKWLQTNGYSHINPDQFTYINLP